MEELNTLADNPLLPDDLKKFCGLSLTETVRRLLKRLVTRDLAVQMSFSGLGPKRTRSRIAFKELTAMQVRLPKKGIQTTKRLLRPFSVG